MSTNIYQQIRSLSKELEVARNNGDDDRVLDIECQLEELHEQLEDQDKDEYSTKHNKRWS